jgi:malic enzyme
VITWVSSGCSGRPRCLIAAARALAAASARRNPRSAHHETVPSVTDPSTIPVMVPAVPRKLLNSAAQTEPTAAAAMVGRWETN